MQFSTCISILEGLGQHSQYSDSLQAGWSRDWIPVAGEFFCTPIYSGSGSQQHPIQWALGLFSMGKAAVAWH